MQTANSKDALLDNWEENFNQLVQGLPLLVNFKFKSLDQAFQRPEPRNFKSEVLIDQSLLNLGMKRGQAIAGGTLVPTLVVVLRDVPNHILNLLSDALVALVGWLALQTDHAVKSQEDVGLQKFLVERLK